MYLYSPKIYIISYLCSQICISIKNENVKVEIEICYMNRKHAIKEKKTSDHLRSS
jgi:hypothetical protein